MKERIAQIITHEQLTSGKFALAIGTQPSVISHILNGRNKPSMEIIQKILSAYPSINPDWLVLGRGSMMRQMHGLEQTSLFDISEKDSGLTSVDPKTKSIKKEDHLKPITSTSNIQSIESLKNKKVSKITVYYSDMTFEEFLPSTTTQSQTD